MTICGQGHKQHYHSMQRAFQIQVGHGSAPPEKSRVCTQHKVVSAGLHFLSLRYQLASCKAPLLEIACYSCRDRLCMACMQARALPRGGSALVCFASSL